MFTITTPVSLLSRECWFTQMPPKQSGAFVSITFSWAVAACKSRPQIKVTIMQTNIRPVLLENIVQFSDTLRGRCQELLACHKVSSKKCYAVFVRLVFLPSGYVGVCWRRPHKKTVPFSVSWGERVFSRRSGSRWRWSCELDFLYLSVRSKDLKKQDIAQDIQTDASDWLHRGGGY